MAANYKKSCILSCFTYKIKMFLSTRVLDIYIFINALIVEYTVEIIITFSINIDNFRLKNIYFGVKKTYFQSYFLGQVFVTCNGSCVSNQLTCYNADIWSGLMVYIFCYYFCYTIVFLLFLQNILTFIN